MTNLKGVWTPILTPQNAHYSIDKTRYFNHLRWLLNHGVDGIVIFGTNGEATSFSVSERMELLDWVKEENIPSEKMCAPAFLFQNNAIKPLSPRGITIKENWVLYLR